MLSQSQILERATNLSKLWCDNLEDSLVNEMSGRPAEVDEADHVSVLSEALVQFISLVPDMVEEYGFDILDTVSDLIIQEQIRDAGPHAAVFIQEKIKKLQQQIL